MNPDRTESRIIESNIPQVNEVIGFLATWSPEALALIAQRFPEQSKRSYFVPGVALGASKESPKGIIEREQILRSQAEPLLALLPELCKLGQKSLTHLEKRLQSSQFLRNYCEIFATIGSTGGIISFWTIQHLGAFIGCLLTLVSSLLALWSKTKTRSITGKELSSIYTNISDLKFELHLTYQELEMLLKLPTSTDVQESITQVVKTANHDASLLNQCLREVPGINYKV